MPHTSGVRVHRRWHAHGLPPCPAHATLAPLGARAQLELRPGGQGPYALLLPLIDGDYRATLRYAE